MWQANKCYEALQTIAHGEKQSSEAVTGRHETHLTFILNICPEDHLFEGIHRNTYLRNLKKYVKCYQISFLGKLVHMIRK